MRQYLPSTESRRRAAGLTMAVLALTLGLAANLLASDAPLAGLSDLEITRARGVHVYHHRGDEAKARDVVRTASHAFGQMEEALGVRVRDPVEIILAQGEKEFRLWAGDSTPEWALAVARMGRRRVVIDVGKTWDTPANDLLLTLRHELAHIVIGQVEEDAGTSVPIWFHEGVAVWVAGYRFGIDQRPFIRAAARGKLIPFDDLISSFPARRRRAALAYLQSEDFIYYLMTIDGGDAVKHLLNAVRRTGSFDEAFFRTMGSTRRDLESEWRRELRRRHPLLRSFLREISLFMLVAAFAAIAFFIVRRRRRRRMAAMAVEEELDFGWPPEDDDRPAWYEDADA